MNYHCNRQVLLALLLCNGFYCATAQTTETAPQAIHSSNPQSSVVTGTVTDAKGEPIIGASVRVKGASQGTITDIDGKFHLKAATGSQLQISFIGYTAQTVTAVAGQNMTIKLEDNSTTLNDVVVVGYGTMRKKDLTGSVIQVKPDNLATEAPKTVQDVLRGTTGLSVGYDASAKGGGSMQVRGQRSVYTGGGHNDPLIILDGMMFYGELSEINPDDIAQIDVLKDASAAAVYGAKGANGVIVVTTKKGKLGKPTINVSTHIGINTKSAYRDAFSPSAYLTYLEDWYKSPTYGFNSKGQYEAYQVTQTNPGYYDNPNNLSRYGITSQQWAAYTNNTAGEALLSIYGKRLNMEDAVLLNFLNGRTFNWADKTFRTGINQDYNASVSGASDKMNYYMSFGYQKNQGATRGDDYRAMRANLKVSGKVTNWLEIGANVNFQDRSDGNMAINTDNMLLNSPYGNYLNEDGTFAQYPHGSTVKRGYNYDFEQEWVDLEKGYTVFNTIFNAKLTLPFGIRYEFNIAPRYQYFYDRYFLSAEKPDSDPNSQGVNRENGKRFDWSLNNTVTWDYTFAKKHHVVLTLVQEAEERRSWTDRIEARKFNPTDALGFHNTSNATKSASDFSTTDTHETAAAYLARLFYSYNDRYMVTASVRRDGYCAFGANYPWATFPSVSLAWSFTNESWFHWTPMSTGKLRFSWGKNGNRSLSDPYIALADLGAGAGTTMAYIDASGNYVDYNYMSVNRMANPNLQWEKTKAINVGLDFGFFNDRLTGSIEAYFMKTNDMIMNQRLPNFTGFGSITTNLGEVQNNGLEISLQSLNIQQKNFEWRTSLSFSYNKNKINHLYYQYEDVTDANGKVIGRKEQDDLSNGWFIGKPISEIWTYKVTGIWQPNEAQEAKRYGQKPGDPKVENIYTADDKKNADGTTTPVYNDKDKQFLGQTQPPIHWSLRNEFKLFQHFDFSFNLYSYMGHKSLETMYLNQDNGSNRITYTFNVFAKDYWTPEHPSDTYGRLNAQGPSGISSPSRLHNRNFIRLDNVSLAYNFPKNLISKLSISNLKVFATVRNVAVWAKDWEYADPETGGLATRTYSFGINLTL